MDGVMESRGMIGFEEEKIQRNTKTEGEGKYG